MDIRKERYYQPKTAARYTQTGWQRGAGDGWLRTDDKTGKDLGCTTVVAAISIGAAIGWILFPSHALEFARSVLDQLAYLLGLIV